MMEVVKNIQFFLRIIGIFIFFVPSALTVLIMTIATIFQGLYGIVEIPPFRGDEFYATYTFLAALFITTNYIEWIAEL